MYDIFLVSTICTWCSEVLQYNSRLDSSAAAETPKRAGGQDGGGAVASVKREQHEGQTPSKRAKIEVLTSTVTEAEATDVPVPAVCSIA